MHPQFRAKPRSPPSSSSRNQKHHSHQTPFVHKPASFWNRIYLTGFIHRPIDLYFLLHAVYSIFWTIGQLLFVEIPLLVRTQFRANGIHHPISWGPFYSFCMAMSRATSGSVRNVAQLRWVSNILTWFIPLRMLHLRHRHYSVKPNVAFKVHIETLLQPERATLAETRKALGLDAIGRRLQHRNPTAPTPEFFTGFLPNTQDTQRLANLPEESGLLNQDGTYTIRGEWIEALELPGASASPKRSNVVLLHLHGGGHVFCSSTFHRQLVTRLTLEFGPGARAFVVDYRLSPEDPFPAAIHDVYATYLYLTQPNHAAITQLHTKNVQDHPIDPVDPRDIVLSGDSAGGGLAIAFMLYMRDYVQPAIGVPLTLPSTTVLMSAWTDISTSLPSASGDHSYCYVPCPMGVNPFSNQATFEAFPRYNFAKNYLCGDAELAPNERTQSKKLEWEWYRHLAQHPLVSPVFTANLAGINSHTILQAGAFDRLVDDTKLYAHKLGAANPEFSVRFEVYQEQIHVFQFFEFLPLAKRALMSIVAFVDEAREAVAGGQNQENGHRMNMKPMSGTHWVVVDNKGSETKGYEGPSVSELDRYWRQQ
ncbi:hypothetical protein BG004_003681 [Podila humilis]|nr:hypothetical protein BG004_003681 [Podila humilis]